VKKFVQCLLLGSLFLRPALSFSAGKAEHVIVIVWDGMRPDLITAEHTPTLHQLARDGVMFQNHHPVYCSATEVNGTAIATGAYPEHSGIIANRNYLPDIERARASDTQSREVIRKGDQLTGGHYLLRPTLAEILQAAGKQTAIAGVKQVALLHDRHERTNDSGVNITLFEGKTLPESALAPITNLLGAFPASVPSQSPAANEPRDQWTTRALLGPLWAKGVPAFSLLWLSEPDSSQHAAGPGSPKGLAALASSDRRLAEVLAELDRRGVRDKTDVFVVSDHGFSTIETSVDVARILRNAGFAAVREFRAPAKTGDILVTGQGGSVLFHVIGHDSETVRKLVAFLQQQDFAGVILTRESMEGTFTLSEAKINAPQYPDVVLSMRWSEAKSRTGVPGLFTSDGGRVSAGNHASLSRFDMHNTLVAAGPDLKKGFNNTMPTGNTDLAPTILWLLGVKPEAPVDGRVLSEALTVDAPPVSQPVTVQREARREHEKFIWRQYLKISQVNNTFYLDEGNGSATPREPAPTVKDGNSAAKSEQPAAATR
jgi:arylsulfatase A-like enzyme